MRERPKTGTITEREIKIPVCGKCGYAMDTGLCSDDCELDGSSHNGNTIMAVYKRTDEFLRDEHD